MRVLPSFLLSSLLWAVSPDTLLAQAQQPAAPVQNLSTNTGQLPDPGRSREPENHSRLFTYVEQMPQFPGGQTALLQTLAQTVRYPTEALEQRQEGRIFVTFVVDTTGAVQDAAVNKPLHPSLDKEAVRAVIDLPNFVPGKQLGKPQAVRFAVPIIFRLPANVDELLAQRAASQKTPPIEAEYDGGPAALHHYLTNVPLPTGFQSNQSPLTEVFVSFVVDAEGKVGQVKSLSPVPGDKQWRQHRLLSTAAINHVSTMPPWRPARQNGKAVATYYTVPVGFAGSPSPAAYAYAEQMPIFPYPAGEQDYIGRNVRYPASALRSRTQGVVLAYYEVAENGQVENARIIQSVSRDIDAEVKNILQNGFPTYQPAQQQGKAVRVFFVVPVTFAIR